MWDKTPSIVKLGAAYYTPLGWAMKAPAMAKFAYDALPERAKEPVRNAVSAVTAGIATKTVEAAVAGVGAVVPAAKGTMEVVKVAAAEGASYVAGKAAEMAPSPETVADAVQRIKEDPKQALTVAKET